MIQKSLLIRLSGFCVINRCKYEDAVGEILRTQLFKDPEDTVLLPEQAGRIDDFVNTMKYFFQYRLYTAQNIELMIMAFGAGRDYQYCTDFQE